MIQKRFIQGDCIEVMNSLNQSFDLILTDPPYNIGWKYSDKVNDNKKNYNGWCLEWAELAISKLNSNGVIAIINYPENNNILYTDLVRKGYNFVQELIWHYPTNVGHSKNKYTRNFRTIIIFSKSKEYIFTPIKQPYKNPTDKRIAKRISEGHTGTNHYTAFEINMCKNVSKDKKNNGINQLPRELVEILIKTFTQDKGIVCDPFVGNGTVMNIAYELGRNSFGIDINDYAVINAKDGMEEKK